MITQFVIPFPEVGNNGKLENLAGRKYKVHLSKFLRENGNVDEIVVYVGEI